MDSPRNTPGAQIGPDGESLEPTATACSASRSPRRQTRIDWPLGRARQLLGSLGSALRNPNIRRVELAWGAAIAAEWEHFVAFGVYAYDVVRSARRSASPVSSGPLPAAIVAPFAASLGDRFPRERFLLALSALWRPLRSARRPSLSSQTPNSSCSRSLPCSGSRSRFIRPALQALLPSLARTPEELIASNGATSTIESLGTLVGPLQVAGMLVSVADAGAVFAAGAAALLVAAFLLLGVTVDKPISLIAPDEDAGKALAAGFGAIARNPRLRLVVSLMVAQAFVRGCLNVLIVVAAFQVFDAGGEAIGYMTAALGVGGLIGAIERWRSAAAASPPRSASRSSLGLPIAFRGPYPTSRSLCSCSRSSVQPIASRTLQPLRCSSG